MINIPNHIIEFYDSEEKTNCKFYFKEFCEEVFECLKKYCKSEPEKAEKLFNSSFLPNYTFTDDNSIFYLTHELPYYWAMDIYYEGKDSLWWKKHPDSWPPPNEYYDWSEKFIKSKGLDDYVVEKL